MVPIEEQNFVRYLLFGSEITVFKTGMQYLRVGERGLFDGRQIEDGWKFFQIERSLQSKYFEIAQTDGRQIHDAGLGEIA